EGELEIIDSADHCAGPQNHNVPSERGALVEVTFHKKPYQEQKYLEAEPKALGVTQIMLSLFVISIILVVMQENEWAWGAHIVICSLSSLTMCLFTFCKGLISGSVAIAAQNLQLPKLKACLGMQIVMCAVSVICFIISTGLMIDIRHFDVCWEYHNDNATVDICNRMAEAHAHLVGVEALAQAVQIAISATLAAFCCKVVNCCSPWTSVPMIVVNTPAAPQ
ncbi:hypothetical protein NFI96_016043, partial [Prochilodus magdalenae]